jgi:uncharacterized membrane protein
MRHRIAIFFDNLRENFWLLPLIMVASAIGLSIVLVLFDRNLESGTFYAIRWFYSGGVEGARDLLSTVASAMMTVAGVTFSITIVALSIASSQFGPRLLRSFMRDTGNQVVLGTFISTFIYCLMVLRTIRGAEEALFVPYISVTVAIILAIASLVVLIYFIHHVSSSINADNVISLIQKDIDQAIEKLYPQPEDNNSQTERVEPAGFLDNERRKEIYVLAPRSGYVQGIDYDSLLETAESNDFNIEVRSRTGLFIDRESKMIRIWTEEDLREDTYQDIQNAVIIGARRSGTLDVEYEINQLVEIAVRALSPSLNDPFTAMIAIDQLSASLSKMAERDIPPAYRYDNNSELRLILNTVTFQGVVDAAFNQIRQYGRTSIGVMIRLLEALSIIANHTADSEKHEALKRQADMIWNSSLQVVPENGDLEDIRSRYMALLQAIDQSND